MLFRKNAHHDRVERSLLVADRLERLGLLRDYTKPVGCKCVFKGEDGSFFIGIISGLHFSERDELCFIVNDGEIRPVSFSKNTDWVFTYKGKAALLGKFEVCYPY